MSAPMRKIRRAVKQKLKSDNDTDIIHLQNLTTKYRTVNMKFCFENLEKLNKDSFILKICSLL